MKKTISVSVSRGKNDEKQNKCKLPNPEGSLNGTQFQQCFSTEDFNNIVIMKGTAKRKPLENRPVRIVEEKIFRESFLKLRAPFHKHQKQASTEEKLMTKSCEVLFECIKPYKDIRTGRKVTKSIQFKTTDTIFERTAVRKVEFLSFCEETSARNFFEHHSLNLSQKGDGVFVKTESNQTGKTVSSEDFITDVLI